MTGELEIIYWDVGQGDCSVIRLPDGRLIVIDVGPPDSPLLDWLLVRPQEKIYAVILTHNDEDHAGCYDSVLEACHPRIEHQFVLLDRSDRSGPVQNIIGTALRNHHRGVELHRLEATPAAPQPVYGLTGPNPVLLYVVHPGTAESMANQITSYPKPNAVSAILCLQIGKTVHAVWPGDAALAAIARTCSGHSPQMIMVPHHGAPIDRKGRHYPSTFDAVTPESVFVSVGTNNKHDHPVPGFIEQHVKRGRTVCCSQLHRHCDRQRSNNGGHVLHNHLSLGLLPPRNPKSVTCRGPMILKWDAGDQRFTFDRFHAPHRKEIISLHNPRCL